MLKPTLSELSPLLSKPSGTNVQNTVIYGNGDFRLRSLRLPADVGLIRDWTRRPYARRFWGAPVSAEQLFGEASNVLADPRRHFFIGSMEGRVVCLIDLYGAAEPPIGPFIDARGPQDAGIHLLMGPPRTLKKGWSRIALSGFTSYFFSRSPGARLFAEPDAENLPAIRLALGCGFRFLRRVSLPDKTAALLSLEAADLLS